MDLGELMKGRASQNIEDLRQPYEIKQLPGGGFTATIPYLMNPTSPPIHYPPAGPLGQSAAHFIQQQDEQALARMKALLGPGIDVVPAPDGGFLVRKTPPMPERNPYRGK